MPNNYQENTFKPGQIVCLESQDRCLYGEVIQVALDRQLCWARPLTIAIFSEQDFQSFDLNKTRKIIDLRTANDLLLPLSLFRPSYDTEAIEILTELATKEQPSDRETLSDHLNNFVRQICQNHPEKFAASEVE